MTKPSESTQQITLDIDIDESSGYLPVPTLTSMETAVAEQNEHLAGQHENLALPASALDNPQTHQPSDTYIQTALKFQSSAGHPQPQPGQMDAPDLELLKHGDLLFSPGGHFTYRVIGACCRLFDRNELPWPCCRLQWRSKEPSWRRIGKRFVPDLATKQFPSYAVEILDHEAMPEPVVITLYWMPLSLSMKAWWYRRYVPNQVTEHA